MGLVTKPNTPTTGAVISAADTNSNLDTLYNLVNGALDNANIASGAAIGNAKLNLASIAQAIALSGGLSMTSSSVNMAKGADISSAATTSIWITDGNFVHVTGSTGPITSFGTASQIGAWRLVVFDSTPTITYNATSLIVPTSANIVAAAGDVALVIAETTANARVLGYWRKDGTSLVGNTASTQADQETATSTTTYVSPGRQQYHPSAAKFWCYFDGTTVGTNAPTAGYNVTSVTRNSTGLYTINLTTAFSSANYCVVAMAGTATTAENSTVQPYSLGTGTTCQISVTSGGSGVDRALVMAVGYGDQ